MSDVQRLYQLAAAEEACRRVRAGASPSAGTWKANLATSKPHPANQFRSATLQLSVRGNVVTIGQSLVGESGQEERPVWC